MPLKINLIKSKSILTKSGLPGADWVINPYNGCLFGCLYCYAAQMARWRHPNEGWGSYLDVKINAPEILKSELARLEKRLKTKDFGSIFFSSVTDPYVALEVKYHLTGKCLEVLADFGYEGEISIQTKSPLVTKDIDILKRLKNVSVGLTVTTLDDKVSRFMEVTAPPVSARIKALEELHKQGIETYAFVGPILPYFTAKKDKLKELLDKLEEVGVNEVWFEHINLNTRIRSHLYEYLKKKAPELIPYFDKADTKEYRDELDEVIYDLMKKRKMKMALAKIIHH